MTRRQRPGCRQLSIHSLAHCRPYRRNVKKRRMDKVASPVIRQGERNECGGGRTERGAVVDVK